MLPDKAIFLKFVYSNSFLTIYVLYTTPEFVIILALSAKVFIMLQALTPLLLMCFKLES
jgi:hypothetical protein